MNLFWRNGYNVTSMQMLEKEMGINKFSIYSSFGSKDLLLKESVKCYAEKLNRLVEKLQNSSDTIDALKQYFYDFVAFSKEDGLAKGCLITNTANEIIKTENTEISDLLRKYTINVRDVFAEKIRNIGTFTEQEVQEKADYLIIAMFGFSSATKIFNKNQLENYIKNIFENI
jgi:AcrR family transcriptional regulator